MSPIRFCLISAGAFFLTGLLTGVWKYTHTLTSDDARAPVYVDTAHRASLLYAFACVLLGQLAEGSAWSDSVDLAAAAVLVVFFAASVLAYVVHGVLRDTNNQLQRPHRLGTRTIPAGVMLTFMGLLSLAEITGFLILMTGFLAASR